jgi:hypothetical protein
MPNEKMSDLYKAENQKEKEISEKEDRLLKQENITVTPDANTEMKNLWKKFKNNFWVLFVFHLLLKGLSSIQTTQTTEENYRILFFASIALSLFVALAMVINVGWYAYLFSKKKVYSLFGLLGLWWAGLIGIFVAYFAVQWTYYKSIGKKFSRGDKLVAIMLTLFSLIFVVSFVTNLIFIFSSIFNGSDKLSKQEVKSESAKLSLSDNETTTQDVKSDWVEVSSPDSELTMSLPTGYEFEEHNSPDSIPGYSYIVYTDDETGTTAYTVKYENYDKFFADSKIINLSVEQKDAFLEQLAESLKNDLEAGVSNFSVKPGSIKEYRAIKFSGDLSYGGKQGKFKGFIVMVGRASYTLSVIYNNESKTEFDRILESFALRSSPTLKFTNFLDLSAFK